MPRLVLIDGSSYLYRAFHALPPLTSPEGLPTGALFGIVNMLRATLKENPEFAAFVVDASGPTFRDDMYPEYKATRAAMPDDLRAQVEPMLQIVQALGFPMLRVSGVEADDVIGTLALQAAADGIEVVISTGDKDFAQLVRPGVKLVNTMSGSVLDEAGVMEKFGVRPDQIVDYLALMGDSVDNIPGVDKCGPKTAAKWLAEHGDLDTVMAKADALGGKIGENLRAALPRLPLNRQLVTIKIDVPLEQRPQQLALRPRDVAALTELYTRYGFHAALRELSGAAAPGAAAEAGRPALNLRAASPAPAEAPDPALARKGVYECVLSAEALAAWVQKLQAAPLIAFDTETDSLDPMQARLVGLSFAVEPGFACYIPVGHDYPGAPAQLPLAQVLDALRPVLADPTRPKVGPARQVRPARAAPARRGAARLRARHHAAELRAQRRRPAPRHGLAGRALPGLLDHPLRGRGRQGRQADFLLAGRRWRKPPPTPPRMPTSPCACTASCRASWSPSRG
jgi:DNA polymerase-1